MSFTAALVQLRSGSDMARNHREAAALIREAKSRGAQFVSTPEMTNVMDPDKERVKAEAKAEAHDPSVAGFAQLAADLQLHLHIGSLALQGPDGRLVNRGFLFAPDGRVLARYDKIHLFDVDLPTGESHRESASYRAGEEAVVVKTALASFGMAICYDVRFPALFNALARSGAEVLLNPAAFTVPTGRAHWQVLLRARAIETGSFMLAAAQGGDHGNGRHTYGHSLIINPWGEVLAEAGDEPTVITAAIDPEAALLARARIPALQHARTFTLRVAP